MTEKRYNVRFFDEPTDVDCCVVHDGEDIDPTVVANLLNDLTDENEQLQSENNALKEQKEELIEVIQGISKDTANAIVELWEYGCFDG